jgi:hypothetical protein
MGSNLISKGLIRVHHAGLRDIRLGAVRTVHLRRSFGDLIESICSIAGEVSTKQQPNQGGAAGSILFGTFSTKFVAGKGDGVVTSFFLNMDEGPQGSYATSDTISLEILGHNSSFVHYRSMISTVSTLGSCPHTTCTYMQRTPATF